MRQKLQSIGWWIALAAALGGIVAAAAWRHVGALVLLASVLAGAVAILLGRGRRDDARHRAAVAGLEQAKRAAEETAHLKGELLAHMSHEIRAPMNGILASAEMLSYTGLAAPQRQHAELITTSAEALLRLIDDILDVSRIEGGQLRLETVAFSLRNVVQGVTDLLAIRALRQGLELRVEIAERLPLWVRGDPSRLRQVLINLTDNAIKFTSEGHVALEVEPLDDHPGACWIRFAVRDTGIGMSADQQASIFDAYRQAESSTSRRYGGTGLGLSISRSLVELMGGRIEVESVPGAGSTFRFALPFDIPRAASRPAPAKPQPEPASEAPPDGTPLHDPGRRRFRLLVAEDSEVNQVVARRMLETLGYRAHVVPDGREALAALDRERYDLVLMDCHMPELDGYETAREIRRREATGSRMPIVAATARAMKGDRERCLAAGMDDYVAKPFRSRDLAAVIDRRLGYSRPPVSAPEAAGSASPAVEALASILDRERLETLAQIDASATGEWLIEVIEDYRRQTPLRLGQARKALATGDADAARQAFHVLSGSSANVGATDFAAASRRLETLARAGDLAACHSPLDDLEQRWGHLSESLCEILTAPRPVVASGAPGPVPAP